MQMAVVFAFCIGILNGLRSMTPPAVVCWAIRLHWIDVTGSRVEFLDSTVALVIFTVLAVGELVADKLPFTPSRKSPVGLVVRFIFGALSGAVICFAGEQRIFPGAIAGAVGAIIGTFAGYEVRVRMGKALGVPDFVVALVEDAICIGGAIAIAAHAQG